jgi:hypothetical protein
MINKAPALLLLLLCIADLSSSVVLGFSFGEVLESKGRAARQQHQRRRLVPPPPHRAARSSGEEEDSAAETPRRDFLSRSATLLSLGGGGAAAAAAGGPAAAALLLFPGPARAVSGTDNVNAKLRGYGLPTLPKVPDGFIPLLEIYGKGRNRTPLLVTFSHPLSWVVTLPSNTVNGEDGTIQAGDYGKGDTATLFVYSDPGKVQDITSQPRELFESALKRCISQRGDNMYQNFKITGLEPAPYQTDGQKYMNVDFKYQLLTGAGFEVDRRGVASVTSEGDAVQVLWAASTAARFKKTERQLRDITRSFRCYADGLNLSDELISFD